MKQLKTVQIFADVKCENCTCYNQGRCCHELPSIPVGQNDKCNDGGWLFNGKIINFRHCCFELLPFGFATDVQDLICKNCGYYDSSGGECHFQRLNTYKSSPIGWCNNGVWLYRNQDNEVILGSLEFLYEKFMEGKDK